MSTIRSYAVGIAAMTLIYWPPRSPLRVVRCPPRGRSHLGAARRYSYPDVLEHDREQRIDQDHDGDGRDHRRGRAAAQALGVGLDAQPVMAAEDRKSTR